MVYTFLALCLAYVGGPGSVEVKMNGYQLHPSLLYCTCCLPALPVNGAFVRMCKRGTLQFVWTKPVLAGLTVVLYTQHMYTEGYWGPNNGRAPGARPGFTLHASSGTKSPPVLPERSSQNARTPAWKAVTVAGADSEFWLSRVLCEFQAVPTGVSVTWVREYCDAGHPAAQLMPIGATRLHPH